MRYTWILLIAVLLGCQPSSAPPEGTFVGSIAGAIALVEKEAGANPDNPVTPGGSKVGEKCTNCRGTGKVGDSTVFVKCQVCDGDGKIDPGDPGEYDDAGNAAADATFNMLFSDATKAISQHLSASQGAIEAAKADAAAARAEADAIKAAVPPIVESVKEEPTVEPEVPTDTSEAGGVVGGEFPDKAVVDGEQEMPKTVEPVKPAARSSTSTTYSTRGGWFRRGGRRR